MKRSIWLFAAALITSSPLVSATTISLNFEEFAYGTLVNDYYNGGKDSYNRTGGNDYGIKFTGGRVQYTPSGAYLSGPTYITINPEKIRSILGSDSYYISFNAAVYSVDYGNVFAKFESGLSEPNTYVNGNGNPMCPSRPEFCDYPVYHGQMGGYYVSTGIDIKDVALQIGFATDRLDNIQIHSYNGFENMIRPGSITRDYNTGRDIPEPASLALLCIGAAAFTVRRNKRKEDVVNRAERG